MFEWITRYFPRRCQTEEAFVEIIRQSQHPVQVYPHIVSPQTKSRVVGNLGNWKSFLRHQTTEPGGRVVTYDEFVETWFGSSRGVGDAHERDERNRSLLKMCRHRATRLLDELPHSRVLMLPEHTGYQIIVATCAPPDRLK